MPIKISKMARLSNKILYASLKKESYGCANKALNNNLKLNQKKQVFLTPFEQILNLHISDIPIDILISWSSQLEVLLANEQDACHPPEQATLCHSP